MKKFAAILLPLVLILAFVACAQTQNDPTEAVAQQTDAPTDVAAPGADVFYGMIVKNMGGTLLVTENKTEGKTSSLYTLSASYLDSEQDAGMLVPGTYFILHYGGYIMESYPGQFGAPTSFTCSGSKEDFVTPLTDFILEKIPSQAQWCMLDLSGVDGLSQGETEAIEYLLMCEKMDSCSIVRYDKENPVSGGDLENGAVLQIEAKLENGKLVGKWTLTDAEQTVEEVLDLSVPYYLN